MYIKKIYLATSNIKGNTYDGSNYGLPLFGNAIL